MPQILCIKVVDFETAMMHMGSGVAGEENGVVVCVAGTEVEVREDGYVFLLGEGGVGGIGVDVEEIGGDDVEGAGVPLHFGLEVLDAEAVVA